MPIRRHFWVPWGLQWSVAESEGKDIHALPNNDQTGGNSLGQTTAEHTLLYKHTLIATKPASVILYRHNYDSLSRGRNEKQKVNVTIFTSFIICVLQNRISTSAALLFRIFRISSAITRSERGLESELIVMR